MERLLVCKLVAAGCVVEALLNGLPVARAGPSPEPVVVPVHEVASAGSNTLTLTVLDDGAGGTPPPAATPAPERRAEAKLLLPRIGHAVDEQEVRTLASVEWSAGAEAATGAGAAAAAPSPRSVEVDLPLGFPRWRWMDAPLIAVTPALKQQLLAWVRALARDLAGGDPASFLAATRLRTEELALAYQSDVAVETERLRTDLGALHAAGRLVWNALDVEGFTLRPVAGGRLIECLDAHGAPALGTVAGAPEVGSLAFPLRVAVVAGIPYVLR